MLSKLILGVLTAVYPFVVYFGLAHFSPAVFGLILIALFIARLADLSPSNRRTLLAPLIALILFSLAISITNSERLLLMYPVIVSLILMIAFAATLFWPPCMIERISALRGEEVPPEGKVYVRVLTVIWSVFFLINMLIAFATAQHSREWWVLYNGLISYFVIGVLVAGEIVYRGYYKRRHSS